jgi:hypothetical protein
MGVKGREGVKEREGVREKEGWAGGRAGKQAYFKVRLGLGETEIQRYRET